MTDKKIEWKIIDNKEWCVDKDNNKNSVEYWGSKEAAEKALRSLKNCSDCSDCSDCRGCIDCSSCRGCTYCRGCSGCTYCRGCRGCSGCTYCRGCIDCIDCSGCTYCSGCSYCENKINNNGDQAKIIIPKIENIHRKVFEAASQKGALNMDNWHICETTHCRAGWVCFLAGEDGKKLEYRFGPALAALMIYRENSSIKVRMTDFYKKDKEALESMEKAAQKEKDV